MTGRPTDHPTPFGLTWTDVRRDGSRSGVGPAAGWFQPAINTNMSADSARAAADPHGPGRHSPRDNTVTTNAVSTMSRSFARVAPTGVFIGSGSNGQATRKVEGLVVRLDRGSSNLPGRIKGPARAGLSSLSARAVDPDDNAVTTPRMSRGHGGCRPCLSIMTVDCESPEDGTRTAGAGRGVRYPCPAGAEASAELTSLPAQVATPA